MYACPLKWYKKELELEEAPVTMAGAFYCPRFWFEILGLNFGLLQIGLV